VTDPKRVNDQSLIGPAGMGRGAGRGSMGPAVLAVPVQAARATQRDLRVRPLRAVLAATRLARMGVVRTWQRCASFADTQARIAAIRGRIRYDEQTV